MGLFFLNPLSGVCSFIKLQERAKTRAATLSFFPSVYLVAPLRANAQTALLHAWHYSTQQRPPKSLKRDLQLT